MADDDMGQETTSSPSGRRKSTRPGISRRTVIIGLTGVVSAEVLASGITWQALLRRLQPLYFPIIQGSYSGSFQFSTSSSLASTMSLDITQQNQQDFGGTCTLGNTVFTIQNGTVDTSGNIQFSINAVDRTNNTPVTVTFTGNAQSGGGWQGTFSATDNEQGTWFVN